MNDIKSKLTKRRGEIMKEDKRIKYVDAANSKNSVAVFSVLLFVIDAIV